MEIVADYISFAHYNQKEDQRQLMLQTVNSENMLMR
jgi:hypothetical protein